jgi:GH15 family glucan-1,4-alpha-glucosidase
MVGFRSPRTGLPEPSWNLWEDRRGIHTFTCAAVVGGLRAARNFATLFGDDERAAEYEAAALEVCDGMREHLYRSDLGRFARSISTRSDGAFDVDGTIDSSLFGIFYFGAFDANDPMVRDTMQAVEDRLWAKTGIGGLARYENDGYMRVRKDGESVPGNPWFICTLWLAEYRIASANTLEELERSVELLEWTVTHALPSGVLAEQVDPFSGAPLSVSPLTWSHSTVVSTTMAYLRKLEALLACHACGRPLFRYDRRARRVYQ